MSRIIRVDRLILELRINHLGPITVIKQALNVSNEDIIDMKEREGSRAVMELARECRQMLLAELD